VCTETASAATTLVMDTSAAREARRFLNQAWCAHHLHVLRPQAEMVLGELVSDAVRHGSPPVDVRLACDGAAATIEVSDRDPDPGDLLPSEGGPARISLVDVLSDEWGVRTRPGGKTVWSRLVGVAA
jgi:hypothetical protein